MPYKKVKHGDEYCLEKELDGSTVPGSCHTDESKTDDMLKALMANEKMHADAIFVLDNFAAVSPGQPFRLLPFGRIVKGGIEHTITPEYATKFRLPHFKPPVKLGSHDEITPAGGFITSLEVREDGLYCIPEWNANGEKALLDGAYRYHSPEVIWDGYYEDPTTGAPINGPLIVGDALLHAPHLGEASALFHYETHSKKEKPMTEEFVSVPKTFWESVSSFFKPAAPAPEPPPEPVKAVAQDKFEVAVKERDDFKSKFEAMQAENARKETISKLAAELQSKDEKGKQLFGMQYVELKSANEAAEMMAGMTEEQRAWCMRNFKAYAAQVDESKLTASLGSNETGNSDNPVEAFDAAVRAKSLELKIDYTVALQKVAGEQPDLYAAYKKAGKEKK